MIPEEEEEEKKKETEQSMQRHESSILFVHFIVVETMSMQRRSDGPSRDYTRLSDVPSDVMRAFLSGEVELFTEDGRLRRREVPVKEQCALDCFMMFRRVR